MKHAGSNNQALWRSAVRRAESGQIGVYKTYKVPVPFPRFKLWREDMRLTDEDIDLLRSFSRNRSQTLGDILTLNARDGSKVISSMEKMMDLGFIKKDWEKELEMKENSVYSLTPEGRYMTERIVSS